MSSPSTTIIIKTITLIIIRIDIMREIKGSVWKEDVEDVEVWKKVEKEKKKKKKKKEKR